LLLLAGRGGKDGLNLCYFLPVGVVRMVGVLWSKVSCIHLFKKIFGDPAVIPTKNSDSLIILLTVTAGRGGKDGRGPMVQSFLLLSQKLVGCYDFNNGRL
jgi:hypothetical protein